MSRTVAVINASPDRIFDVLDDPFTYTYWVVGCKRIRYVERTWPEPGSGFHHSVGVGPLATNDETRVVRRERPHLLELDARAWPAGAARVQLRITPAGNSSTVEITETPVRGPAKTLHNPLLDAAAHARNNVALVRLARVAEGRL